MSESSPQSHEAVALAMAIRISNQENIQLDQDFRGKFLDLYAECLVAAYGNRDIKGSRKSSVAFSD